MAANTIRRLVDFFTAMAPEYTGTNTLNNGKHNKTFYTDNAHDEVNVDHGGAKDDDIFKNTQCHLAAGTTVCEYMEADYKTPPPHQKKFVQQPSASFKQTKHYDSHRLFVLDAFKHNWLVGPNNYIDSAPTPSLHEFYLLYGMTYNTTTPLFNSDQSDLFMLSGFSNFDVLNYIYIETLCSNSRVSLAAANAVVLGVGVAASPAALAQLQTDKNNAEDVAIPPAQQFPALTVMPTTLPAIPGGLAANPSFNRECYLAHKDTIILDNINFLWQFVLIYCYHAINELDATDINKHFYQIGLFYMRYIYFVDLQNNVLSFQIYEPAIATPRFIIIFNELNRVFWQSKIDEVYAPFVPVTTFELPVPTVTIYEFSGKQPAVAQAIQRITIYAACKNVEPRDGNENLSLEDGINQLLAGILPGNSLYAILNHIKARIYCLLKFTGDTSHIVFAKLMYLAYQMIPDGATFVIPGKTTDPHGILPPGGAYLPNTVGCILFTKKMIIPCVLTGERPMMARLLNHSISYKVRGTFKPYILCVDPPPPISISSTQILEFSIDRVAVALNTYKQFESLLNVLEYQFVTDVSDSDQDKTIKSDWNNYVENFHLRFKNYLKTTFDVILPNGTLVTLTLDNYLKHLVNTSPFTDTEAGQVIALLSVATYLEFTEQYDRIALTSSIFKLQQNEVTLACLNFKEVISDLFGTKNNIKNNRLYARFNHQNKTFKKPNILNILDSIEEINDSFSKYIGFILVVDIVTPLQGPIVALTADLAANPGDADVIQKLTLANQHKSLTQKLIQNLKIHISYLLANVSQHFFKKCVTMVDPKYVAPSTGPVGARSSSRVAPKPPPLVSDLSQVGILDYISTMIADCIFNPDYLKKNFKPTDAEKRLGLKSDAGMPLNTEFRQLLEDVFDGLPGTESSNTDIVINFLYNMCFLGTFFQFELEQKFVAAFAVCGGKLLTGTTTYELLRNGTSETVALASGLAAGVVDGAAGVSDENIAIVAAVAASDAPLSELALLSTNSEVTKIAKIAKISAKAGMVPGSAADVIDSSIYGTFLPLGKTRIVDAINSATILYPGQLEKQRIAAVVAGVAISSGVVAPGASREEELVAAEATSAAIKAMAGSVGASIGTVAAIAAAAAALTVVTYINSSGTPVDAPQNAQIVAAMEKAILPFLSGEGLIATAAAGIVARVLLDSVVMSDINQAISHAETTADNIVTNSEEDAQILASIKAGAIAASSTTSASNARAAAMGSSKNLTVEVIKVVTGALETIITSAIAEPIDTSMPNSFKILCRKLFHINGNQLHAISNGVNTRLSRELISFTADTTKACTTVDGYTHHNMYGGSGLGAAEPESETYYAESSDLYQYASNIILNRLLQQQYKCLIRFIRVLLSTHYKLLEPYKNILAQAKREKNFQEIDEINEYITYFMSKITILKDILEHLIITLSRIIDQGIFDYSYSLMPFISNHPYLIGYLELNEIMDTLKECCRYHLVGNLVPVPLVEIPQESPTNFVIRVASVFENIIEPDNLEVESVRVPGNLEVESVRVPGNLEVESVRVPGNLEVESIIEPGNLEAIPKISDCTEHPIFKLSLYKRNYPTGYRVPIYEVYQLILENPLNGQRRISMKQYDEMKFFISEYAKDTYPILSKSYLNTSEYNDERASFMKYVWGFVITEDQHPYPSYEWVVEMTNVKLREMHHASVVEYTRLRESRNIFYVERQTYLELNNELVEGIIRLKQSEPQERGRIQLGLKSLYKNIASLITHNVMEDREHYEYCTYLAIYLFEESVNEVYALYNEIFGPNPTDNAEVTTFYEHIKSVFKLKDKSKDEILEKFNKSQNGIHYIILSLVFSDISKRKHYQFVEKELEKRFQNKFNQACFNYFPSYREGKNYKHQCRSFFAQEVTPFDGNTTRGRPRTSNKSHPNQPKINLVVTGSVPRVSPSQIQTRTRSRSKSPIRFPQELMDFRNMLRAYHYPQVITDEQFNELIIKDYNTPEKYARFLYKRAEEEAKKEGILDEEKILKINQYFRVGPRFLDMLRVYHSPQVITYEEFNELMK